LSLAAPIALNLQKAPISLTCNGIGRNCNSC
jgi:hypothetical protein